MNKLLRFSGALLAAIFLFSNLQAQSCSDGSYSYDDDIYLFYQRNVPLVILHQTKAVGIAVHMQAF